MLSRSPHKKAETRFVRIVVMRASPSNRQKSGLAIRNNTMKTDDLPVKDQETPFVEGRNEQRAPFTCGARAAEPVLPDPDEQDARLSTPTLSISPEQPTVWSGFSSEPSPPWSLPPGTATPYSPRKPVRWPWIVLALLLAFVLICGGIVVLFGVAGFAGYASIATGEVVNVTLPARSAFHLNASTTIGSINTNVPGIVVRPHQQTGADAHGDVGSSPQVMLTLITTTGSINLYQE